MSRNVKRIVAKGRTSYVCMYFRKISPTMPRQKSLIKAGRNDQKYKFKANHNLSRPSSKLNMNPKAKLLNNRSNYINPNNFGFSNLSNKNTPRTTKSASSSSYSRSNYKRYKPIKSEDLKLQVTKTYTTLTDKTRPEYVRQSQLKNNLVDTYPMNNTNLSNSMSLNVVNFKNNLAAVEILGHENICPEEIRLKLAKLKKLKKITHKMNTPGFRILQKSCEIHDQQSEDFKNYLNGEVKKIYTSFKN